MASLIQKIGHAAEKCAQQEWRRNPGHHPDYGLHRRRFGRFSGLGSEGLVDPKRDFREVRGNRHIVVFVEACSLDLSWTHYRHWTLVKPLNLAKKLLFEA